MTHVMSGCVLRMDKPVQKRFNMRPGFPWQRDLRDRMDHLGVTPKSF
jgi:hypothetical protein